MTTHDNHELSEECPTPTHAPAREDEKVERDGKLYLPVPHPLIEKPAAGSWGETVNSCWRGTNYFLRGLYGTFVEWGVSWMDLALEYPKVAVLFMLLGAVTMEETMNENPMVSGTFQYVLYSMDPEAAHIIFPPETKLSEAEQIIEKMAADILTRSAEDYYQSPEYHELELQVRAKMHTEVREALLAMSGITTLGPPPVVAPVVAPAAPVVEEFEVPPSE